jgi:hypothetical protein
MDKQLYDIEVYKNYFCVGLKNYVTKEIIFYEISEERNDIHQIYKWFDEYCGFLVSFNGIHYDNMVIKYLLLNYNNYKNLNYIDITLDLKYFSDKIISDVYDDEIKKIKYNKVKWIDIDLFNYWSKMLRISKKISLKSLGVQLGYPVVQELPYKPNSILKIKDLPTLRYYNYTHDLGILELLLKDMEEEVKLRASIKQQYNLDCWSWDAPKIASEALLQDYCKITNKNVYEVRSQRFERPTLYLNECLKGFDPEFKLPIFQDLWTEILSSKNNFSKDLIVNQANTSIILTYGVGGLHSVNSNEQYYTDDKYQVITSDVASLYPNLMINYACLRFPEVLNRYIQVKDERLVAKANKDKAKDKFLKLILNSTSGLIDNQHSWLYYPEGAMRLRLIGQIILTKCIEECILNNWQVVSANTDGIEVIIPKDKIKYYEDTLNKVCTKFNLILEHELYNKIVYKNVNNYIAETESKAIKRKGFFKLPFNEYNQREIPLGDSCNELVISKALFNYYINNIDPKEFISNPDKYNLHIYDYCKSNKISKNFVVYWNGKIQQQLNRYYFSKKGAYLFKQKDGIGTMQHVNVGQGVMLFNQYEDKQWSDYNIDYNYYISATQKIIDEINRFNQLTLF